MPCEGKFCSGCTLEESGVRRVPPEGNGSSKILLLGESPWVDEVKAGRPFSGAAGSYLDKLLRMTGITRSSLYITNVVNCKIPYLGYLDQFDAAPAIEQCQNYLDEAIRTVKPRVVLALGNVALRAACGVTGITSRQAYTHDSHWGIPCIPTFHPSYLMRGAHKLFGATAFAFLKAKEIAKGEYKRLPQSYLLDPPLEQARAYFASAPYEVAVDVETPRTSKVSKDEADELDDSYTLIRVGFNHTLGTAISMPYSEPYISLMKEFMAIPHRWILWNENYDIPRLLHNGFTIAGETLDAMWEWHFLQSDLLKGLDFVAPFFCDIPYWSDLADSQPAYYNACDNDATLRCHLGIKAALEKQGRWQAFETHCMRTGSVLKRMGPRGVLIDKVKQAVLKERLEAEYASSLADLQQQVPESVRKVKTWVKGPKVVTPEHKVEKITCPKCGGKCGQTVEEGYQASLL